MVLRLTVFPVQKVAKCVCERVRKEELKWEGGGRHGGKKVSMYLHPPLTLVNFQQHFIAVSEGAVAVRWLMDEFKHLCGSNSLSNLRGR